MGANRSLALTPRREGPSRFQGWRGPPCPWWSERAACRAWRCGCTSQRQGASGRGKRGRDEGRPGHYDLPNKRDLSNHGRWTGLCRFTAESRLGTIGQVITKFGFLGEELEAVAAFYVSLLKATWPEIEPLWKGSHRSRETRKIDYTENETKKSIFFPSD